MNDAKNHNPIASGLGFAIAMAIGATLGVLFAPKEGSKTQKDVMKKASELAKGFNKGRKEVQEAVQNIFGEVTEEFEKDYLEIQGNVIAAIDELKDKSDLTHKKYKEIVEDTVAAFSKGKHWAKKTIDALTEELQNGWDDVNKNN